MISKIIKNLIILVVLSLVCSSLFALARVELVDDNTILINGEKVAVFRVDAFGQSKQDRASLMAFELIQLAQNGYLADNFTVISKSSDTPYATILINNNPITIVTDEDGAGVNSDANGLAHVWVNNIRKALAKVSLYMTEKECNIPLNETRVKNLYGYYVQDITFKVDNPEVCTVEYNETDQTLTITGKELGKAIITIYNGIDTVEYTVYVKKYAAIFPAEVETFVTGNPIPADFVESAMKKNIAKGIETEPGATFKVNSINWAKKPLYPGQVTNAEVNITAYGDNYISVTKPVRFAIKNIYLEQGVPDTLLYSNNPETFDTYGDLFVGHLEKGKCNRLLYHHMNKTGHNAIVVIEVINPNSTSVDLRVRRGAAKPQVDTIAIGLVACKQFMNLDDSNVSVIDTLPPNSRTCYLADDIKHKMSSSGIMQFWQMTGEENCLVRVRAVPPADIDCSLNKSKPYLGTGEFILSDYTFLKPQMEFKEEYKVGGPWVFMSIGKFHLENEKHLKLYGNYGVTYFCNVDIENPTNEEATVRVYLDPTAGPMAAYVRLNNSYTTIHHLKPPKEYELAVYKLKPGEKRKVSIKTIPVSGSNYPAKLCVGIKPKF